MLLTEHNDKVVALFSYWMGRSFAPDGATINVNFSTTELAPRWGGTAPET
jgi:hypothetical protein